ncbi:SigE family RNA polymerase sigma factor [Asanoa siamensis]|uniref:DNA-directed RNA polymerase sigma-70 factor n=1 Tax=Asanoa siamensis TaxID=926357 RepID=A0ABQ4D0G4_9ACTN|nr:SigE family RNA polymerase sigma factor [Asanoa siamensis]GIF77038.1 DNA-directed RNA polymerase sigma-70 factor [Asanoa siamensis]
MTEHTNGARGDFADFVRVEVPTLTRAAYLMTGDRHHAEDLVQTTLARVAVRWDHVDEPAAYARRVLYTQSVSWWRRRAARVSETLTARVPDQPRLDTDVDVAVVLERALHRLTPRQRAVLVLRFFEDRTESETAELLNCRIGTVKSQTRHALRRLRELSPDLAQLEMDR